MIIQNLRILVVEDSPIIRRAYSTFLREQLHQVDSIGDGLQAASMAANKYDVILMDVHLPHINGIDVTSKLRRQKNSGKPVIIGITSDTSHDRYTMCLSAGMNEVLYKPVELKLILSTIEKYFL